MSTHPSFKESITWSPDSKKVAYAAANRLFMVDADGDATRPRSRYNEAGGYQVSGFSPDGKWLVYTRRDDDQNADVYLFEIATKKEHNLTQNPVQRLARHGARRTASRSSSSRIGMAAPPTSSSCRWRARRRIRTIRSSVNG